MKTMYVDKRSELTLSMKSLEIVGMRCYRIKTQCGCTAQGNIRNAVIAIKGKPSPAMVIKCKKCARR